jgi:hypothetical protein
MPNPAGERVRRAGEQAIEIAATTAQSPPSRTPRPRVVATTEAFTRPRTMTNRRILAPAVLPLLAALLFAAGPAAAQSARGPVLPRAEFVRLSAAPRLGPRGAADGLAERLEPSRPHLYVSVPMAAALGVGGMLLGYGAGLTVFGCEDESPGCEHGPDDFEYALAYTGLALGAATGAHVGGKTRDGRGSFWATLGGAAIGALPILIAPKDDDQTGAWVGSMAGATAGAALVDYLVRRPRG